MADYAPPAGPPPPKVPEGWKAVWNDQYKEWFYVNTYTKASQWDKPTAPAHPAGDAAPSGPPPGYDHSTAQPTSQDKKGGWGDNNPYGQSQGPNAHMTEDERLARKMQDEENARAGVGSSTDRGAADSYYGGAQAPAYGQQSSPYGQQSSPYGQQQQQQGGQGYPPQSQSPYGQQDSGAGNSTKKGFFGKMFGGGGAGRPPPQQQYGGGYPPQQGYGGYGGPPQGYPPQQGGYYPPQQQAAPQKHGMSGGAGLALGLGGGLLGGALLGEALENHDEHEYDQGYEQGAAGDDGDYGGGDDGGDFGGDGGGDF